MLPLAAALKEAHHLAQSFKREQRGGVLWRGRRRCAGIVGGTHGERRVGSIRELDDEVRINTVPDPNQRDALAA